jgi:hypothetical protein
MTLTELHPALADVGRRLAIADLEHEMRSIGGRLGIARRDKHGAEKISLLERERDAARERLAEAKGMTQP